MTPLQSVDAWTGENATIGTRGPEALLFNPKVGFLNQRLSHQDPGPNPVAFRHGLVLSEKKRAASYLRGDEFEKRNRLSTLNREPAPENEGYCSTANLAT